MGRGLRLNLSLRALVACAALFFLGALLSCGDSSEDGSIANLEETLLHSTPFKEIMTKAFPGLALRDIQTNIYQIDGSPQWLIEDNGPRLVGHLNSSDSIAGAMFFAVSGPPGQLAPGMGLTSGTYAALAGLNGNSVAVNDVAVLTDDAASLVPLQTARSAGKAPFVQERLLEGASISFTPAFASDLDGDGVAELILRRTARRGRIVAHQFDVFHLAGSAWHWQRAEVNRQESPVLTVLNYWAAVSAAASIGARWDPDTRLFHVWNWLLDGGASVTPELLAELSPVVDQAAKDELPAALEALRASFKDAYSNFSSDFKVLQPWPGFINGFRHTEQITVEDLLSPTVLSDNRARITHFITLAEREGGILVTRRYKVMFEAKREGGTWLLDGVEAEELR